MRTADYGSGGISVLVRKTKQGDYIALDCESIEIYGGDTPDAKMAFSDKYGDLIKIDGSIFTAKLEQVLKIQKI